MAYFKTTYRLTLMKIIFTQTLVIVLAFCSTVLAQEGKELARYYPDKQISIDIDLDKVDEEISLISADVDGDTGKQVYIVKVVEGGKYVATKGMLIDGWNLAYLFTVEIYSTLPPYIAVGYTPQGEKPYSIDLFRYKDDGLTDLKRIAHFESDIGSILLEDVDGDDIMEIVVKNESGDSIYKYIDDDKWEIRKE